MFKPMLAVEADLTAIRWPLLASFKMDGIRAVITPDGPRTRSLKPVPNRHIAAMLATLPPGLDGEIGVLDEKGSIDFRTTTGDVMRQSGEPSFKFFVFDNALVEGGFETRWSHLHRQSVDLPDWVVLTSQMWVRSKADVEKMFEQALALGYEGLILRCPAAPYKHGRSTLKEQGMLKVKPWADDEAILLEVLPECENTNEAKTNELGRTHRSSAKAGKVARERAGVLVVTNPKWPKPFEIGTGMDHATKDDIWARRHELIGQHVRFRYITVGGYDVPRHTSFDGFRAKEDMDAEAA